MDILPTNLSLPALYTTESSPDPLVMLKLFHPASNWTWYATEGNWVDEEGQALPADADPRLRADFLMFGLVIGLEAELGYFSLRELQQVRGPVGFGIERDLWFVPTPLSAVRAMHAALMCA